RNLWLQDKHRDTGLRFMTTTSVIDVNQCKNGHWISAPYREQTWGTEDFTFARIEWAKEHGYRWEKMSDGSTIIFETEHDFAMRQQKKLSDKADKAATPTEHVPEPTASAQS